MKTSMIEDFRKTAPEPLAPVAFDIPQPFETELENNLKVVIFEDSRLPIVSFRLAFQTGNINEPADSNGLNSAMTSMLTEGTKSYTSRRLAEEIERLGAHISANSSQDNTIIAASALSLYTSDILRLMSEIVLFPTFPESELNLYKQNTIENLKFQRSQPGFLADEQMSRVVFGSHPYSITSPTPEDIEKLTREKLAEFHTQKFVPNNAILIVVGDVKRDDILEEINKTFGDWKQGSVEETKFEQPPTRDKVTVTIVDRSGSAQSNIVLANLAIERGHPDFFAVLVMNQILGSGGSSRLFMNLREEKGYTYGAYSSFDMRRQAGAFEATAEVRTDVTGDSLKEFFYELNRIRDEKVSEEELKDAKNFLTGVFPIRAETQEGLTNLIVSQKLYDLPADYLQTYREKISEVTIQDVDRVAKKYITPDKIAIVIVGDAEEILPQVQLYSANIEIFDTEGKAKDISDYGKETSDETVDVSGDWNLTIDFQGQSLPVTLKLEQAENQITGSLDSMLGKGKISDGKVKGKKFSATAKTQVQGQEVEVAINGELENGSDSISNTMKGTISLPVTVAGETLWWDLSGGPATDASGQFAGFRGTGTDVTVERRSADKINRMARYDTLTGLPNRLHVSESLADALTAAEQWRSRCGFLIVGLDRFKAVNDTLGHAVGDRLLSRAAERLQALVSPGELCGRMGADEFGIVFQDGSDQARVEKFAQGVIDALSQPYDIDQHTLYVGASAGVAIGPRDGQTAETLMRSADLALFRAKDGGGNAACVYEPQLHVDAEERRVMEIALRRALANGELHLNYQPVVAGETGTIEGFEALLRWTNKQLGNVSPAKFIPVAEQARLIGPIGEWVLKTACRDAMRWPSTIRVAVNVSFEQLHDRDFAKTVAAALAESGLPAHRLELEVTESVFMNEAPHAVAVLKDILAMGVRLSLDDFGTGYSSLGYLSRTKFSTIKIDRSFVQGAAANAPESTAIIRAVVALADSLGMSTTAEGVETDEELAIIRRLGCRKIQGYLFGRPMSARDADALFPGTARTAAA